MARQIGRSVWDIETPSEGGMFSAIHGVGSPPLRVYRQNPVSFLEAPCGILPFFSVHTGEREQPINQEYLPDAGGYYDIGQLDPAGSTGAVPVAGSDSYQAGYVSPRSANNSPLVIGQVGGMGSGAPLGLVGANIVPLWGSRKGPKGAY